MPPDCSVLPQQTLHELIHIAGPDLVPRDGAQLPELGDLAHARELHVLAVGEMTRSCGACIALQPRREPFGDHGPRLLADHPGLDEVLQDLLELARVALLPLE